MANAYDRLFKENIEPLIPLLAEKIFGLKFTKTEDLKDKIQITIESEADFLKKVLHSNPKDDYILHIEFQVKDDLNMISRMLLYRAFLYNKYKLTVKQFVFYVGLKKPKMQLQLAQEDLMFQFSMRNIHDFPVDLFINSINPEEVILAILSDFKNESPKAIIKKILKQLQRLEQPSKGFSKYVLQLEVLSKLRNLQEETTKEISTMPFTYDLKTDIRYKQGQEIGKEIGQKIGEEKGYYKNQVNVTRKMLLKGIYSIEEISAITGLSIDEILKLSTEIKRD